MQVRQGDLLLESVEAVPDGPEAAPENRSEGAVLVIAEGEASGHAHAVRAAGVTFLVPPERGPSDLVLGWLRVEAQAALRHEQHAAVELPAGLYRITQQRRYDPARAHDRWRRVMD